jgi:O-antigen/teichoic acid export membrane protein
MRAAIRLKTATSQPPWPLRRWSATSLLESARHYLEVLAGTTGRLALQAVYFLTLANTLPLTAFGTFAAAAATGMMLGAFSGLGFGFTAFRTAVRRPRLLSRYMGLYLVASIATLPLLLLVATPIYLAVFAGSLTFGAFAMIVTAEALFWRLIEGVHKVNNGLGRFARGALVIILTAGARAIAAVGFALSGGASAEGSLETWAVLYFAANLVVTAVALGFFCPPVRLGLRPKLIIGRFRESILPALSASAFDTQTEIDKLVIIVAAGQRAAGIYAISVRIIELAGIPLRLSMSFTRAS